MTSIKNEDLLALQSYVTGSDSIQYSQLAASTLLLNLSHSNLKQRHIEIRFDKHSTISTLRQRIFQKTGTSPSFQHLKLLSPSDSSKSLFEIPPGDEYDQHKLGFFPLDNGSTVHCVDTNPYSDSLNGNYEDTSLVQKYKMSEADYNKRRGTLREWSTKQKERDSNFSLAKHAREHREKVEAMRQFKLGLPLPKGWEIDSTGKSVVRSEVVEDINHRKPTYEKDVPGKESVENIEVGMRCQVQPGGRRGEIQFVGRVKELGNGGYWVGVKFDEPVGKADGRTPGGKRYFDANPGCGGFCRAKNVETGDFPEIDIFADCDSDDEL